MRNISLTLWLLFAPLLLVAQKPHQPSAAEIELKLQKLNFLGSVLYVAAHPDDENTRVITYLAKDRNATAGYMSMTRGDGGQNLIGSELGDRLGLIRTQELLAARRIDGGRQFFSRAVDFGFSKSADETLAIWGKDEILSDVVRVFRQFQPDVILTRFPPDERAGHGHHTSSAILAQEAFDQAADATFDPATAKVYGTWKPFRLYTNTGRWWNNSINKDTPGILTMDVGAYSPLLGESAAERAAVSRSQHKSQGFGSSGVRGETLEYFEFVKGEKANRDVFDGINTSWSRLPGGEKITPLVDKLISSFDGNHPERSIPQLVNLRKQLKLLAPSVWKNRKRGEVEQLIKDCLGLYLEVTADRFWASPGETVTLNYEMVNRSPVPVTFTHASIAGVKWDSTFALSSVDNHPAALKHKITVSAETPYSGPYWLSQAHLPGRFQVSDPDDIGKPEKEAAFSVTLAVSGLADELLEFELPVVYRWNDPVKGEQYRPFEIVPPVSSTFGNRVYLFKDDTPQTVNLTVQANSGAVTSADVKLHLPSGWTISPTVQAVSFDKLKTAHVSFLVTPPSGDVVETMVASVAVKGKDYTEHLETVSYDHIPSQVYIRPAASRIVRLALQKEGNRIGYIRGAGDDVPAALQAIGYDVWEMNNEDVTAANLVGLDAVILGIRAINTNDELKNLMPVVLDYVKQGGTAIVQYNTATNAGINAFVPYPITLSRDRVTQEDSPVELLNPNHAILNTPNKIELRDFEGWVQERGLYFPREWDKAYTPLLSMHDKDEDPLNGSLLVARFGSGHFIYTGLSFFRQLPEGVPGAYKLFVNLVSAGKPSSEKMVKAKHKTKKK